MVVAIVLAAGSGSRMGTDVPKQFLDLDGMPVVARAMQAFESCSAVDAMLLVTSADYAGYCREEIVEEYGFKKVAGVIAGGSARYDSVRNALEACTRYFGWKEDDPSNYVLIHDGARPYVTEDIIVRVIEAARLYRAAAVGMPAKDTVKIADRDGFAADTPDRRRVWTIQTPQAFSFPLILAANDKILRAGLMESVTDDAMVVERSGLAKVKLVEGAYSNIKITTPEDFPDDLWKLIPKHGCFWEVALL